MNSGARSDHKNLALFLQYPDNRMSWKIEITDFETVHYSFTT